MQNLNDIRQRAWDFGLTVLTVVMLGGLGFQGFVGTLYVWWAQRTIPNWEQTGYDAYIGVMNTIATPMLMMLVVLMGLCVPKRLFSRALLVVTSALMVLAGVVAGILTRSVGTAVAVYLSLAALIQVAVVLMTAAGVRGPSYLTQGRLTKLGSGLLHLGFIIFGIVIAALQKSPFMLPVFWTSTVLMIGGTVLSFYADRLTPRRTMHPRAEAAFDAPAGDFPNEAAEPLPAEHPIEF